MGNVSSEVICKCGNKGWIELGEVSYPCPNCGRRYEFVLRKGIGKIIQVRKISHPKKRGLT